MSQGSVSKESISETNSKIKNRHSPTLDSILMVEDVLLEHRVLSKTQLWKRLPKAMQYGTLTTVLEYLEASKKITYDNNEVFWIFSNEKTDALDDASVTLK